MSEQIPHDDDMAEESTPYRLSSRRRRRASKKSTSKKDVLEDLAITTATSTGIEISPLLAESSSLRGSSSWQDNHESKGSMDESEAKKSKKKKKKSGSKDTSEKSFEDIQESSKKSKKKKKSASLSESPKSSATKASPLFPSSPKKKKKSSSDKADSPNSPSIRKRKSKTRYKENGEDENADSDDKLSRVQSAFSGCVTGKPAEYEAAEDSWHPPKGPRTQTVTKPSLKSIGSIETSVTKSRSDVEDSSHMDIRIASPIDKSVSKRGGSMSGQFSFATYGSTSIDEDTPSWKKNSDISRLNSPMQTEPPSLEEDDTIVDDDDDFFKLHKSKSKSQSKREVKSKLAKSKVSEPPMSEDSDDSDDFESSDDEVDDEPEWIAKQKSLGGPIGGSKVAYDRSKAKDPKLTSAPLIDDKKDATSQSLPSWAIARNSLKKTGSTITSTPPAPSANKNKNSKSITSTSAPIVNADNDNDGTSKKESKKKNDGQDASISSLPTWATDWRSSKKSTSTSITKSPAPTVSGDDENDSPSEKEADKKEDEQDVSNASQPSWASARKSLKKTGSTRNTAAPSPTPPPTEKAEPDTVVSDGRPPWAMTRDRKSVV